MPHTNNIISVSNIGGFKTEITSNSHTLIADEPVDFGGTDLGMNPYELFLAALGSCTAMTVRMYAKRKDMPLENILINLYHDKNYAADCDDCESNDAKIHNIKVEIKLTGNLTGGQRDRLFEISKKCPIHKTLTSEIRIDSVLEN